MDRFKITKVNKNERRGSGINLKNFMRRGSKNPSAGGPDTFRKFSVAALTREALPRLDNYRISKRALKRPSIGELHGEASTEYLHDVSKDVEATGAGGHGGIKLGWIEGVVIPCLLNIWGVMLFLRLSWVIGQSGILQSLAIIGISALVCVITTLSLSAISTNGEVKGGGVYFIISRSLGPEFGASIGIVFALANAVAASMNTIGFCNSLNDLLKSYDLQIVDGGNNDVRIVGVLALLIMILICCVGMEWEAKAQNFLLVTIIAAIINFLIGCAIGPRSEEAIAKGFVGFNSATFIENLKPDYRFSEKVDQDFFSVFAIFFPSVTGIQAGANISGDLKDPAGAIPKGTLLALGVSMVSYVVFVFFGGAAAARDASGNVDDLVNGTLVQSVLECRKNFTCEYGLQNSYSVMQLMSVWGPLIYAGCFAATLSTALTNLLSVPRLIQALGIDRIYPGLIFFSKPYGKHGEPYRGYVLTFIISAGFLLIAELNAIAPLISNFYLASYALINFCTFHAALVKPLGWRPTFKYYNSWISLFGFVLCVIIMFLIDWLSSLITFVIILALYLIVVYRKPDVNWGSSTQAQTYKTALTSALKLQNVSDHVKNYRPQVLVLAGAPENRPPLIDLAHLITKHNSLMIVGNCVPDKLAYKDRKGLLKSGEDFLNARKIKAFYNILDGCTFDLAASCFLKISGIGKLSPNILLMGFKSNWRTCEKKELLTYFDILHNAFSQRKAVAILRLPRGLDFSELEHEIKTPNGEASAPTPASHVNQLKSAESILQLPKTSEIFHVDSNLNLSAMASSTSSITLVSNSPTPSGSKDNSKDVGTQSDTVIYMTKGGSNVPKNILDDLTLFSRKQPKGTIDVWWLYDDGGFTMLLPYIISTRTAWSNCKLRVFALTSRRMELEVEKKNVENLLSKLRISFSAIIMLEGVTERPKQSTIDLHESLLEGFKEGQNDECFVLDTELKLQEQKTYLQLRLHEMLKEYSSEARLIVLSLPMARQENATAALYLSWLEMLTMDLPPTILVRGNQASVLTCYS